MIDAIATQPQFADHIIPIWDALHQDLRGTFYRKIGQPRGDIPTLVAASGDLRRARQLGRRVALVEHGAGQSYGGDPHHGARHSSYAGGEGRDAQLFLHPGPHPAARDRARYPAARVEIVGSPRLDSLPAREPGEWPVVALSFHWDCHVAPEARSAWRHWRKDLRTITDHFKVIGHGHPRIIDHLAETYRTLGIEVVRSFDEVCRRADLYVCDNSSTLFEFAATGRPVVVLNAPWYRRSITHGLRFWEAAGVGVNVWEPADLVGAVDLALSDPPEFRAAREEALGIVYAHRSGAAQRAASVLEDWIA